jgi:hypothetical protein
MKKTFLLTSFVALLAAQSAFAANFSIQNNTASFWDIEYDFNNGDIWFNQGGIFPTITTADQVLFTSKTANSTVNVINAAVSSKTLKVGSVGDAGNFTATLNVSQNFTTADILQVGVSANGILNVDGAVVTSGGNATFGNTATTGVMNITSGGIFDTAGTFVMAANSTVTVDDGILKMLAGSGSRITMVSSALLNLNGGSQLWLGGNQTGASSVFNGYIASGLIKANGNVGAENFSQVFDGTNTIVTVIPEPATYAIFGGLLVLGCAAARRSR